jgi:signal transduction histidine kinase
VTVQVRRRDGRAILEVADDGRGIDPQDEARAREGSHMGLQLLRELVHDAGGTLDLRPGDAGGTVMHVEVPAE